MGDCANCPLRVEIIQIKDRQDKFDAKVEQLSESNQKNEIWQGRADLKFEHIITALENVQTNIQNISDRPMKRLDSVTTASIIVVVTAIINLAFKIFVK